MRTMEGVQVKPSISIVTPAYNGEDVLPHAAEHVLAQLGDDTEWIIVDDGSTDGTLDYAKGLQAGSDRVRVIHTENAGAGAARNRGIREAHGTWTVFLDADDFLLPGSLERMVDYVRSDKATQVDIIYTPKTVTDMSGTRQLDFVLPEEEVRNGLPDLEFWTSLYRTEYLRGQHIEFPTFREQDVETAFRILAFNRTDRIVREPDLVFYAHRDNPDSNVHTWEAERLFYVKTRVYDDLLRTMSDAPRDVQCMMLDTLYGVADRYLMMARKQRLHVDPVGRLTEIRRIGRKYLGKPVGLRTTAKKMVFLALGPVASFLTRKGEDNA